ncbi:conserved hypothetical protein [Cyanobium sp. PCC 7001]|uniref:DUF3598 family protein n=1 Tax=Cyanobium sp. PCC 7001 TaxID=180281 RepID=UPI0001805C3A|nr:DUF3598 family protein [Cyanobium sp. PCC 7001]EDY37884.1 conserved hypothetical protein [Cyanobium sp. PCC 7001]
MGNQWENFCRNLGEWRGSFANLDAAGNLQSATASILTLESREEGRCVLFRLRRYGDGGYDTPPLQDHQQEYRSLGKQVVFFDNGSFSKGSLQVAPATRSGAEFGFVGHDRRWRLVQLHGESGAFESLVLIREFRAGSGASERPALTPEQLLGTWQGQAATVEADWPVPSVAPCRTSIEALPGQGLRLTTELGGEPEVLEGRLQGSVLAIDGPSPRQLNLLPDGGSSLVPLQVSHRQGFTVEAAWLSSPTERQRLIRRYNDRGAWISASHLIETRVA